MPQQHHEESWFILESSGQERTPLNPTRQHISRRIRRDNRDENAQVSSCIERRSYSSLRGKACLRLFRLGYIHKKGIPASDHRRGQLSAALAFGQYRSSRTPPGPRKRRRSGVAWPSQRCRGTAPWASTPESRTQNKHKRVIRRGPGPGCGRVRKDESALFQASLRFLSPRLNRKDSEPPSGARKLRILAV